MRKTGSKKLLALALIAFSSATFFTFSNQNSNVNASFEGSKSKCETGTSASSSSTTSGSTATGGGDWTQTGTASYKNAQTIWNYWKDKGFSGAAISGILGNIDHEGGFAVPDRAQGHLGSDDESKVGVSKGVVPDGGGAGYYQFTPYTKYAPLNDSKWLDIVAQSDFVWSSEVEKASWRSSYTNESDPKKASQDWFAYYERGASYNTAKDTSAQKAYELFGGANISGNSAISGATTTANSNDSSTSTTSSNYCGNSSSTSSTTDSGNVVTVAKSLLGYFTYSQTHGVSNIGSVESPDKNGKTDCSGFVWLVLKKAGYKVPDNMAWYTKTMEQDAKGDHKYLKEISANDAKAGDIIIVNTGSGSGDEGHTAILEATNSGGSKLTGNNTKIIQEGGSGGKGGVNEGTIDNSFGFFDGKGATVTFAEPVK